MGCEEQKVARIKGPRIRKVKEQEKGSERIRAKKSHIFYVFVPYLQRNLPVFGENGFFSTFEMYEFLAR